MLSLVTPWVSAGMWPCLCAAGYYTSYKAGEQYGKQAVEKTQQGTTYVAVEVMAN